MAFVTQDQLEDLKTNLNETMGTLRNRFTEQDTRFHNVEQRIMIMESAVQARLIDAEEKINILQNAFMEIKSDTQEIASKTRMLDDSVTAADQAMQYLNGDIQASLTNLNDRISQSIPPEVNQAIGELNRLMQLAEACARDHRGRIEKIENEATHHRSNGSGRDILDPRNLVVEKFHGDVKEFKPWRKSVQVYMSRFYPGSEEIMPFLRRAEVPIARQTFEAAADSAGVDLGELRWTFEDLNGDAGTWLLTKIGKDPTGAVAAAGEKFFNMHAQLNQEFDKLTDEAEGQLMGAFASLAGRQSKTIGDLKANLRAFESALKEIRETLGRDVEMSLKKSVLIALLDPTTKLDFVKSKILNNYEEMRRSLTQIFCHGLNEGPVPMEVNSMTRTDQELECPRCDQQPQGISALGNQAALGNSVGTV